MQTRGAGFPVRKSNEILDREVTDDRPMIDSVVGNVGEGLRPLRMEPLHLSSGLEPVEFVDGLDELTHDAIRANGARVRRRHSIGEAEALKAAERRADQLGFNH